MPTPTPEKAPKVEGIPEIIDAENREEARVQELRSDLAAKEAAAKEKFEQEMRAQREKAQADAAAEVVAYKEQELTALEASSEESCKNDLASITASSRKRAPGLLDDSVAQLLQSSLLR